MLATTRQILKSALLVFRFIEFKMLMVFNYKALDGQAIEGRNCRYVPGISRCLHI